MNEWLIRLHRDMEAGTEGTARIVVRHPRETLKPKSVEQFRVSVKGDDGLSSASLTMRVLRWKSGRGSRAMFHVSETGRHPSVVMTAYDT